MNLRTYSAPTMAEALLRVKRELGEDAVILHTRTYSHRRWLGLRRNEVVEVTAGSGIPSYRPPPARPATRAVGTAAASSLTTQNRATAISKIAPRKSFDIKALNEPGTASQNRFNKPFAGGNALVESEGPPGSTLLATPAANTAMVMGLTKEVGALRDIVSELVRETRCAKAPDVPADLLEHYTHLIRNQVADELASQIVRDLRAQLRPEHLRNEQYVRDRLTDQIEKLLPTSGPIIRTKRTGPHVVALIGPTGVGKTTTIAKLAANLKLRESRPVGLITIDTYRIAAVEQLRKYADILGAPLKVVGSPEDLKAAIAQMQDVDFILIDTAGRSPSDALKLNELRNFIAAAAPDEVHLVLSSTASQACIERAVERFSHVRVDKIIFTKLDEAVNVGMVFNVMRKLDKSLSYITTGQDVPDDIEVGKGRRLAQMILSDSTSNLASDPARRMQA